MIMGSSKHNEFSAHQNQYAKLFKALAHPARIAILECLFAEQSCVCGSMVDQLPLAQSTVSQHLKEMRSAGLIQACVVGTSVSYCIQEEAWIALQSFVLRDNTGNASPAKKDRRKKSSTHTCC